MTRTPWFSDEKVTLLLGDAHEVLSSLGPASVDCIVTSPPYWRTRDYEGTAGQLGHEPTPAAYIEALRTVFAAARRVLADDGTLWLNLGDRYGAPAPGASQKQLLGIPWRAALALQADGWILRSEIIWHKPNAVPESCRDRLARRHEHLFLFAKCPAYAFDLDSIRQPYTGDRALSRRVHRSANKPHTARGTWPRLARCSAALGPHVQPTGRQHLADHPRGRNPGTVWQIPTRPSRLPHTAAYPIDLPLRAIAAGCRPGGHVLDPFSGTATTGVAARQLGRTYTGIELVEGYHHLALPRLLQAERISDGRRNPAP
ncbi:site-specific DNA-methyltransferase [Streptomyces sp. NPDC050315]|uniref:DNA-methyltransferase n=1 Tax=Streptomyces sp. NPDC050315 TaxID=3155039 RepID=UPI00344180FC